MKKSKSAAPELQFHKTVPLIRDFSLNPSCQHGPTILFERNGSRFFACSAYRDKKLCSFHMPEEHWTTTVTIGDDDGDKSDTEDDLGVSVSSKSKKRKIVAKAVSTLSTSSQSHDDQDQDEKSKSRTLNLKAETKVCPLLNPTQRDKGEAQYHFTDETVQFFIQQFQNLGISHVLCIGAPSIHEFIRGEKGQGQTLGLKSFILDIDSRLIEKYSKDECALYNMCNHHFFKDRKGFDAFIKSARSLAIITDPPFGAKAELIWNGGLKNCRNEFTDIYTTNARCELFWIFPYFNEGHILSKCVDSDLKMSDYKVMYKNHKKFGKTQSKSSPVRIFTTAPLSELKLPPDLYRFCELCDKWVDKKNIHCTLCKTCPTKDGGNSYSHCKICKICVKPTWKHCQSCHFCHLATAECSTTSRGSKRTFSAQRSNSSSKKRKKSRFRKN